MFEFNPKQIEQFDAGAENAGNNTEKAVQPAAEEIKSEFLTFLKEGGKEAVKAELRQRYPDAGGMFTDFQAHEVAKEMFARYEEARQKTFESKLQTMNRTYNDLDKDHPEAIVEDVVRAIHKEAEEAMNAAHEEAGNINANMNQTNAGGSLEQLISKIDWQSTKSIEEDTNVLEFKPAAEKEKEEEGGEEQIAA